MSKLVYCVIEEIKKFIEENRIKFIKIKNVRDRHGNPKDQYKCEDWLTTELYFRFHNIFHTVEPEPKLSSGKRFDFFIEDDKEHLWIEAKERFNGGNNRDYLDDLIEAICKFIEDDKCKELLFFSTYDESIDKININENDLAEKLYRKLQEKIYKELLEDIYKELPEKICKEFQGNICKELPEKIYKELIENICKELKNSKKGNSPKIGIQKEENKVKIEITKEGEKEKKVIVFEITKEEKKEEKKKENNEEKNKKNKEKKNVIVFEITKKENNEEKNEENKGKKNVIVFEITKKDNKVKIEITKEENKVKKVIVFEITKEEKKEEEKEKKVIVFKITKEEKEEKKENKIEILLDREEIKLCTKTLYLHFYIITKLEFQSQLPSNKLGSL